MYNVLLEYYDELFPVESSRLDFVEDLCEATEVDRSQCAILDIGCATGAFALSLARRGFNITGIDLDPGMIQSACRRNSGSLTNARFFTMDMRDVSSHFKHGGYSIITCLGNTLAHLGSSEEIVTFLGHLRDLLLPNGIFAFQLVNFDYLRAAGLNELPPIISPRARFERHYTPLEGGLLSFETTLYSSSDQKVMSNQVPLYPIGINEMKASLGAAGFGELELYADFSNAPFQSDSLGVVGATRR